MLARLKTERKQDRGVERERIGRIENGGDEDHGLSAVGEQVLEMKNEIYFGGEEGVHFVVVCWSMVGSKGFESLRRRLQKRRK